LQPLLLLPSFLYLRLRNAEAAVMVAVEEVDFTVAEGADSTEVR
jgi:hypothetical protein